MRCSFYHCDYDTFAVTFYVHVADFIVACISFCVKADAEYKVFRQAMLDGKEQTARHLEDIQRQADILTSDRQHCEDRAASLEREKSEVEMVASLLRQRSTELDALSEVCLPSAFS